MDWEAIAAELDALEVWSQDKQTAIIHLTNAIEAGLGLEFDVDSTRRTTLEVAVTTGYRHAVRQFIVEIAGTPLADELALLTDRELLAIADTIEERLIALEQELRGNRAALQNQGFNRLDLLYFERHDAGNPEPAWRTGFSLAAVAEGYPLPRERSISSDDERVSLTDEVYEQLTAGEHVVVVGEAGSGKSTVCKQIAYQWHSETDRGAVLYRRSASTTTFDEPGTLIEAIRSDEDELLVVVEDAPRADVNAIFEVLAELGESEEVAVLLDARTGTWESDSPMGGHTRLDNQRRHLTRIDMPAFDERECQRAIEHYQEVTGEKTGRTGEQVFAEVRDAEIGGPLMVAYQLAGPAIDTDRPVSALHGHVRQTYATVEEWADGEPFSETVAVMVNVLNAAELPVEAAFIHALAADQADHQRIERTLGFLEGTMFEQDAGALRMPHSQWSALYLECMLDVAGEPLACDCFERCAEALFRLVDEEARREQVGDWLRSQPDVFTTITKTPEEIAGWFVHKIAEIGMARSTLGVLYGTPETWGISLPNPCPTTAYIQWFTTRGRVHLNRGALDAAQVEFEQSERLIDVQEDKLAKPIRQRAIVYNNFGEVARKRGNFGLAEEHYEEALAFNREISDRYSEAINLHNLGTVALERGELELAEEYLEESLILYRKTGDRHGEATSLNNFGEVARKRGELGLAEEYHEVSLAIKQEIGDRLDEAASLVNLGLVAETRGDLELAEEYYEESLAIDQEIGDCQGEAHSLGNLGNVACRRGELGLAEEYLEESLSLYREIGNRHGEATSLNNLKTIVSGNGEFGLTEEVLVILSDGE